MDSFIVRIYRRAGKARSEPAGTVEHVGTRSRVGFAGREQLLQRLLEKNSEPAPPPEAAPAAPKSKPKTPRKRR